MKALLLGLVTLTLVNLVGCKPVAELLADNLAPQSPSVSINGGATTASSSSVTLTLSAQGANFMYVTNTSGCASGGTWEAYQTTKSWTLAQSSGTGTVYAKFKDKGGNETACVTDQISISSSTSAGWYQEAYLKAPNADAIDIFGKEVSISGDTVIVSASGEDSNQTTITNGNTASSDNSLDAAGAVYVFKRTGTTWAQEAYLKAPNAGNGDFFGGDLLDFEDLYGLVSISGDTIVVGAYGESSDQTTITNGTTASGSNLALDSGAAYVFRRTGPTWAAQAYIKAPNAGAGDCLGPAAISGETIVVGAPGEDNGVTTITNGTHTDPDSGTKSNSGAAYVFAKNNNTWINEAYLKASDSFAGDQFGISVGISGDTIVVGATGESSNQTTISNGTPGSADTSLNSSGAAYVFRRTATTWSQEAYLKASNSGSADVFGTNVSISGDTIVVGAPGEDSNQTTISNGTTLTGTDTASQNGAAYVFKRTGSNWAQQAYLKASRSQTAQYFGATPSISGDTIVVGAPGDNSSQTTIINGTTSGAAGSSTNTGAAYVFKQTGSTWAQEAYLKAPNAETDDGFGVSTAISGDTVVIGASGEDSNQTTITNGTTASSNNSTNVAGAVYIFRRSETVSTPVVTGVTPNEYFPGVTTNVVVISGTGFRKDAAVTVGGTACTSKTVQGPNEIICTLPVLTGPDFFPIQITNPGSAASNTDIEIQYF